MATPRLGKHFDPRFLCCLGGWNTQNIMRNPMLGILGPGNLVISVRYFPLGAGRWGRNEAASPGRPRPPDPGREAGEGERRGEVVATNFLPGPEARGPGRSGGAGRLPRGSCVMASPGVRDISRSCSGGGVRMC